MSTFAPFVVGLVASGVSYGFLSRTLVTSRNKLILEHFTAEGAEPALYYPVRKRPGRFGRPRGEHGCPKAASGLDADGSSSNGSARGGLPSQPSSLEGPKGEHELVTNARNKWNAAVLSCSDAIIGALYGAGAVAESKKAGEDAETRDS